MNWRRLVAIALIGTCQLSLALPAAAQAVSAADLAEARRANAVGAGTARSSTSASSVVPGYSESPREMSLYGSTAADRATALRARALECAARPGEPACSGAIAGSAANSTPRAPLAAAGSADAASANQALRNPAATLGGLGSYYSGCTEEGVCSGSVFCFGTNCFDKSALPDQDFNAAMSYLEAGRQAGTYMDANKMTVFDGEESRCREDILSLQNCCAANGKGKNMSNKGTFGAGTVLVYDILMRGNQKFVMAGVKALASGSGYGAISGSLSLYGVSFTANPVLASAAEPVLASGSGFVITIDPLSLAVSVFITVALDMMSCEKDDMLTGMKDGAGLCVTLQPTRRCVRRVLGICVRRETTKCCFNSMLARIINQQGRTQLGLDWGSAASPRCTGFTLAQLERLDFSRMDLTEFYASLVPPSTGEPAAWSDAAKSKGGDCYYGEGKCIHVPPPDPEAPEG